MLEAFSYKNHLNEVISFGTAGIYVDTNELHDYEWKVTSKNNKIASLSYGVVNRSLPIIIICDSESDATAAKNLLFEVAEKDVLASQPGQIIIGSYYYKCYITKSKKKDYLTNKRYLVVTLTVTSDKPYWVKETSNAFSPSEGGGSTYLDFPFEFPFDFESAVTDREITNTGFVASNFRIIIYGACSNPSISISGHVYQVNCSVGASEYLTIDSTLKTITLTKYDGTEVNKFNERNKNSYVFEKIPSGNSYVSWDGSFSFDVILLEERSEPKWT